MFVVFVGVGVVVVVCFLGVIGGLRVLFVVLRIVVLRLRGCLLLGKVRLFVCVRYQGGRIESVPLKQLIKLSGYRKRRWSFEDGWLVLEAF
jgi:hypothetical protein